MEETPLVGIGLLVYNGMPYVAQALDSLLAQTYTNFKLIISDNASTDGTGELCEKYAAKDARIQYIRQDHNLGQIENTNVALKNIVASAEFCMFAAFDDVYEPEFIERCMERLTGDPDAAMAFSGQLSFFWKSGRVIPRDPRFYFPSEKDIYKRLKQFILFYSHDGRNVCMYGIWRRKIIAHERFRFRFEDDVSFSLRNLSRGYFLLADGVLFKKGAVSDDMIALSEKPFSVRNITQGISHRFERCRTEFSNMAFLIGVPVLTVRQKIKLVCWNLFVVGRIFTKVKI